MKFTKMHTLGNDFVVIDATKQSVTLTTSQIQKIANRRLGVGCDQLLVIECPKKNVVHFHFRIFNADGSEVGQCGNGACCIARFIRAQKLSDYDELLISTINDTLELRIRPDDKISVKMGIPQFDPRDIPFITAQISNTYEIKAEDQIVKLGVVNIGNPHAIIPVEHIDAEQVSILGLCLSTHELFPEGINVGFMRVINSQTIQLRVYERGTGETLACGSGACAAVAIGRRLGLLQQKQIMVSQSGGNLIIDWQGPQTPIIMTGPAKKVFEGEWLN
nr:diaminopimelate epimerase [Coxiella endosymbiont of Amblyomma nuttalli]